MQPPNPENWKSLMHAIEADDGQAISRMAAAGGDDFAALLVAHHPLDEDKRTPLMLAYWWGKALASTALVNAGSDYQQPDAHGHGAVWYARKFGAGQEAANMGALIEASERRLSMEKVIARSAAPDKEPPKRRKADI